jgi:Calpain family cysteine protease/Bacterial pre-peptidase C-terminal domain
MSFAQLFQPSLPLTPSLELRTQAISFGPQGTLTDPLQTSTTQLSQAFHASSIPAPGHGDTLATATNLGTISSTYSTTGAIDSPSDVDFFRFRLSSASSLNIALTGLSTDADMQLLNSSGSVIASSTNGSGLSDSINYATLAAGDYYVKIYPYTDSLTNYNLSFSTTATSNLIAAESNIGLVNGTRVFSNWVGNSDTSDIYSFSLNSTRTLNMTLSGLSTDVDIRLIRDVNGNGLIDSNDFVQGSSRDGLSAEWLNPTLGAGNYFVQVYQYRGESNYNLTISTGDWYSNNLTDAGVIGQARTFGQDGSLSRVDMMSILRETRDDRTISATEMTDLRRIVSSLGHMMPDSVRVLSNKIVNSDPANARSGIGNLFAGSSDTQMDRLINKWFLGGDRPAATGTYRYTSGSLFQNGISVADINQGGLGDCYLLATLGAYASDRPSAIQNMFTDNGDGTFTVRLFNRGVADYVTVDRYLPTSANGNAIYAGWNGGSYSESNNELWVALAEKAYAQINQSGWIGQDNTNSYAGIEGGWMAPVMHQITGTSAASQSVNSMTQVQLVNLVNSNVPITAGFVSGAGFGVVNEHAYTITSYNAATGRFHLNNPWGNTHADVTWAQLRSLSAQIEWG